MLAVPFGLLHYWGEDGGKDAWARAEVLVDAFARLTGRGAAWIDPFPAAYQGTFLARFEDINPGGSRFNTHDGTWQSRFDRVKTTLDDLKMPMNLGLVARYADPYKGEAYAWDTPNIGRARLRKKVQGALDDGWGMISHGFTHQYGDAEGDYTGVDWEFSDNKTGTWVYLPYEEQLQRILDARKELTRIFGKTPEVWETPHLDGNQDTYKAVAAAGYKVMNEGDTHLFPNRWGLDNNIGGHVLNVPHTASFVPYDTPYGYLEVSRDVLLPRAMVMRSPFFSFYHGYLDEQEHSFCAVAYCAKKCNLWRPTVLELGRWWLKREATKITVEQLAGQSTLRVTVSDPPPNGAITVRVPDGSVPKGIVVNDQPGELREHRRRGIGYARVSLAATNPVVVEVNYEFSSP